MRDYTEDGEPPQGTKRDRLVFALIICKPEQRQLTTVVPDAMDLAVAQNPASGVSARFGATPVLRRAAPRHHLWWRCLSCIHSSCFRTVDRS